jgi:predicted amidophosphoribosyltransferase
LALERKHAARRDGLKLFAQWLAAAARGALAKADMIVPVPLQWTRLALRGFNQAGWLAAALARQASKPMRQDVSASQAPPQPRRAEPQTAPGQWRRRLSRRRPGRWPRHPGGG